MVRANQYLLGLSYETLHYLESYGALASPVAAINLWLDTIVEINGCEAAFLNLHAYLCVRPAQLYQHNF